MLETIYLAIIMGLIVFTLMCLAYDDNIPFALYNRTRCKLGKHPVKGGSCPYCGKLVNKPGLRLLDVGR